MVADVAAGTGKLTRLLTGRGATVVAVEPVGGMRAQLVTAVPGVHALGAIAEALPLRTAPSTRSRWRRPSTGSTATPPSPSSAACCGRARASA